MTDPTGQTAENVENEVRAQLTTQLIGQGLDRDAAREAVDLAFHATKNAIETIMRLTETARNTKIRYVSTMIAFSLLRARMDDTEGEIEDLAVSGGLKKSVLTVSVGAEDR
ncbi:MAG: hypothetical protein WA908_01620 [Pontixanthobacter sp.]